MNKLTNYEKGYIEAFLDGEGCISLPRKNCGYSIIKPEVGIYNTNLQVLEKLQKMIGGGSIRKINKRKSHYKDAYALKFNNKQINEILPQLKLIIKKHKAKIILKVLKLTSARRYSVGRWNPDFKKKELLSLLKEFYKYG